MKIKKVDDKPNFTDEENFYEMLNEAREEAGCACVQENNSTEK